MAILDLWLADLPQQFLGQPRIETLIFAFARQLQELERVFADINEKTDLETATGVNLDYVGHIIPLTRKEAAILAGAIHQNPSEVMADDEQYRKLLKYQSLVNTSDCAYHSLMEGASFLWDTETTPLYYGEDPEKPATIILRTPALTFDADFRTLMNIAFIRPAGVGVELNLDASGKRLCAPLRIAPVTGDAYIQLTVPAPDAAILYGYSLSVEENGDLCELSDAHAETRFSLDDNGDLYYLYDENETPPTFSVEDGKLYEWEEES